MSGILITLNVIIGIAALSMFVLGLADKLYERDTSSYRAFLVAVIGLCVIGVVAVWVVIKLGIR